MWDEECLEKEVNSLQNCSNQIIAWFYLVWFPAPQGGGKKAPGVPCSRMRQISMVTCILLRYTKITTNFSLSPGRPHCRTMLLARNVWKDLKSEIISL